jgi:hypothetical protein
MPITARRLFLGPAAPADIDERERAFYDSIKLANGTFKTTRPRRLEEITAVLVEHVGKRFRSCQVLDLGASSGISTVELDDALKRVGVLAQVVGSDLAIDGFLVRLHRFLWVLADEHGNPLQYDLAGVALRPWRRRLDYVSGYWVVSALLNTLHARRYRRRVLDRIRGSGAERVRLLTRRAVNRGVTFLRDDILEEPAPELRGRFHVIRAANLVNRAYFGDAQIRAIVRQIGARLVGPGALVCVCRTASSGRVDGSIFVYRGGGEYDILAEAGRGSEVAEFFPQPAGTAIRGHGPGPMAP